MLTSNFICLVCGAEQEFFVAALAKINTDKTSEWITGWLNCFKVISETLTGNELCKRRILKLAYFVMWYITIFLLTYYYFLCQKTELYFLFLNDAILMLRNFLCAWQVLLKFGNSLKTKNSENWAHVRTFSLQSQLSFSPQLSKNK